MGPDEYLFHDSSWVVIHRNDFIRGCLNGRNKYVRIHGDVEPPSKVYAGARPQSQMPDTAIAGSLASTGLPIFQGDVPPARWEDWLLQGIRVACLPFQEWFTGPKPPFKSC